MNRRLFVVAGLALGGCATVAAPPKVAPTPQAFGELEPLYSAQAGREGLTIQVASSGCTAKADFAFYVDRRGGEVTLAFGRKRVDVCRSFGANPAEFVFTWDELGVEPHIPVHLLNPVVGRTGP